MMSGDVFSFPSSVKAVLPPHQEVLQTNPNPKPNNPSSKKRRNLPGTPDPDAEVIALSPKSLMATNRFICEVCNKGFQREQNLQLHRRGHNLPWKLKQRNKQEPVKKKVYICPEKTCIHHDPSRALGDLTGVKKHFSRKHGEKKWKCEKCSKKYAVQSDWKAHSKTCGTREYKCDCGTLFSRKDSFITHRAFCDALTQESSRITSVGGNNMINFPSNNTFLNQQPNLPGGFTGLFRQDFGTMANGNNNSLHHHLNQNQKPRLSLWLDQANNNSQFNNPLQISPNSNLYESSDMIQMPFPTPSSTAPNFSMSSETLRSLYPDNNQNNQTTNSSTPMSATALLQKASQMGSTKSNQSTFFSNNFSIMSSNSSSSPSNTPTFTSLHSAESDQVLNGCSNLSSLSNNNAINLDQAIYQTVGMQTPAVSMNMEQGMNGMNSSLTRDFLGVKFDYNLSSAMGLSHYSSNSH